MARDLTQNLFVAGHRGMVGSAILRKLRDLGYQNLITRNRQELDLLNPVSVQNFFSENEISVVYLAAAKVGGIHANDTYPAEFIYQNLMIQTNVIHSAHVSGIENLLFLGSSCIYPRMADQPIQECSLLTGQVEPTNAAYAIAKIAGIKMCEAYNRQYEHDYRSVMPTNLYGPGDNYHPENSHVIPGLLNRFHTAARDKTDEVSVWGSGRAKREFLHVDDLASACIHVMEIDKKKWAKSRDPGCSHINIGYGSDVSIAELARLVAKTVGFEGKIVFDTTKPDGTPRKLLDNTAIHQLGWQASHSLEAGLQETYRAYQQLQVEEPRM